MTLKMKYLSLLIVALLAAIFFMLAERQAPASVRGQEASFALQDTLGLQRIDIGTHRIERQTESWEMNGNLRVDDEMLRSLFAVLTRLEVKRGITAQEKDKVADQFLQNGIPLKVYIDGQPTHQFTLAGDGEETFAQNQDGEVYAVHIPGYFVYLRGLFDIRPQEWEDRTLIRTDWRTLKEIQIQYSKNPENNLTIRYEQLSADSGFYQIPGLQSANPQQIYRYVRRIENFRAAQYLPSQLQQELRGETPLCNLTVKDINPNLGGEFALYAYKKRLVALLPSGRVAEINPNDAKFLLATPQDFGEKAK